MPSLDTPVCHAETKRFNEEAAQLPDIAVLCVSADLPFGQKRWCGAEGVDKVATLSDHRAVKFGEDYGVLIQGVQSGCALAIYREIESSAAALQKDLLWGLSAGGVLTILLRL